MEYFTREWASGKLAEWDYERVLADYQINLSSLDPSSPVRYFAEHISLSDAWLDSYTIKERELSLRLLTGDLQRGYWLTTLTYLNGRVTFGQYALDRAIHDRPTEVWHDEFSGSLPIMMHRFTLVAPSSMTDRGEFHVQFTDFCFAETRAVGRELPAL